MKERAVINPVLPYAYAGDIVTGG